MKDMTQLAMDGLKLMTFVYCDLSYRRRELIIQPDANEEFRGLCSNDHPVTDNLFGDDLGKNVEDMIKANKVGSKISGKKVHDGRHTGYKKHHTGHNNMEGFQLFTFLKTTSYKFQCTRHVFRKINSHQ